MAGTSVRERGAMLTFLTRGTAMPDHTRFHGHLLYLVLFLSGPVSINGTLMKTASFLRRACLISSTFLSQPMRLFQELKSVLLITMEHISFCGIILWISAA